MEAIVDRVTRLLAVRVVGPEAILDLSPSLDLGDLTSSWLSFELLVCSQNGCSVLHRLQQEVSLTLLDSSLEGRIFE